MATRNSGLRVRPKTRQQAPIQTGEIGFGTHHTPSSARSSTGGKNRKKVSEGRVFQNRRRKQDRKTALWYMLVLLCIALPVLFRVLLLSPVRISGDGMAQTIKSGQVVLLDRTACWREDVSRFDIVLCEVDGKTMFRRVIGLPGEIVEIEQGVVYVNGRAIRERTSTAVYVENFGPVTVPKGQYFMLGDNRPISMDSRTAGMVAAEKVFGKAACYLLPLKKLGQTVDT